MSRSFRALWFALVIALATGVAACGGGGSSGSATAPRTADAATRGDIPDTQAYVDFTPANGGFHVSVPEGWARTDLPTGAIFQSTTNSVRVEAEPAPGPPTVASVTAADVPRLQAAGGHVLQVRVVPRPAGDAVVVRYQTTGAKDPVTGKRATVDVERYQFWSNGTKVTLTLSGAKGADNVDPWRKITDSFRWAP